MTIEICAECAFPGGGDCMHCQGKGTVQEMSLAGSSESLASCVACGGTGECPRCSGTGVVDGVEVGGEG